MTVTSYGPLVELSFGQKRVYFKRKPFTLPLCLCPYEDWDILDLHRNVQNKILGLKDELALGTKLVAALVSQLHFIKECWDKSP